MINNNNTNETSNQHPEDTENLKYLQKVASLNSFIVLIYTIIYIATGFLLFIFIPSKIHWIYLLLITFLTFEACYISGWLITLPLRMWIYSICKQRGTLTQEFTSWLVDWLKVLLVNLLFTIPLVSMIVTFSYYQRKHTFYILLLLGISVVLFRIIKMYITLWVVHGFYILKDGTKYSFWRQLLFQHNIKEYPILVLTIEKKAKWANAFAFGWKGFGFIYCSDVLLNNLNEQQFAAIMAHETAHLENNDIPKRFLCIFSMITLYIVFITIMENFSSTTFGPYSVLLLIFIPVVAFLMSKIQKSQENEADKFAKKLLGAGKYMAEALEYLYDVNKIPKDTKGGKFLRRYSNHPTFEERQKRLLGG